MATIKEKKPIERFSDTKFEKTPYAKKLEKKLLEFTNIDNEVFQKSLNTTFKLLFTLNPTNTLEEIEEEIERLELSVERGLSIKEVKCHISLINSKLENLINPKNDIELKEVNTDNKIDPIKLKKILFDNRHNKNSVFFNLFYLFSILTYTYDKSVIFRVNNLSDKGLVDYLKKNVKFFSFDKMTLDTLYSLGGGKKKFYKPLNKYIKKITALNFLSKFVDPFFGGGGSFYSSFNSIQDNDMKVVLNDLNPSIYNLNKHIQSKRDSKKIMKLISLFIQKIMVETDMFEPSLKEYQNYHRRLQRVLNYREKKEGSNRSVFSSSILLFLLNNNFGGNYETNENGSVCSVSSDIRKFDRFFNFVGKIELYNYLYNSVKVKFYNKDYKEILKLHSKNEDTYTTLDPPYLKQLSIPIYEFIRLMEELDKKYKQSKTEKQKKRILKEMNQLLEGSPYNYGLFGDNFPHEELLKDLSLIKGYVSYFNYTHPIIGKYCNQYGLDMNLLGRKSNNGKNKKGVSVKQKFEVFMTGKIS